MGNCFEGGDGKKSGEDNSYKKIDDDMETEDDVFRYKYSPSNNPVVSTVEQDNCTLI